MTTSILNAAAQLLRQHYGAPLGVGGLYRWATLVRVVVGGAPRARRGREETEWIDNGPLGSARDTFGVQPAGLAEHLEAHRRSPRLAGTLSGLAHWWLEDDERERESSDAWNRPVDTIRNELRSVPGISVTLADRILLLVGGLPAFPIDRATMRIVGRHGWIELSAEYEEWQAFFARGAENSADSLAELHHWFGETGGDYCRVQARCDECPLRSLLPPSGPAALSNEESE